MFRADVDASFGLVDTRVQSNARLNHGVGLCRADRWNTSENQTGSCYVACSRLR